MDGQYWDRSGVAHDSHEAMVSADNANQASGHWAYKDSTSMSSVIGGGKAGFGGILYILKIIPYIISFCVYFLFSIFETLKGGKGRLLQSIAFGILAGLPVSIPFSDLFLLLPVGSLSASPEGALMLIVQISQVFSFIVIALIAIWYYRSHYWAVRCMHMNFLVLLINPLTIFVFGAVLMFIITFVMTVNGTIDGYAPNSVVIGIPFIIAAIFYFKTAKPFIEQAKYLKSRNMPFPEWESKSERKQKKKQEKAAEKKQQENQKEDQASSSELKQQTPAQQRNYLEYTGDTVWVKSNNDGNFYAAKVNIISDDIVEVTYPNDEKEERNKKDVLNFSEAMKRKPYTPHGYWEDDGLWYKCQICKVIDNETISIRYEDGTKKNVPPLNLAFIKR
ncbi:MAG: hypothetical protein LBH16_10635 [Treponema sp.]|jgi:hypothetical protein|nr:hypothetical protein [Treponema sp.]